MGGFYTIWLRWGLLFFLSLFFAGCFHRPVPGSPMPSAVATTPARESNERVLARVQELVQERFFDPAFRGHDWTALVEKHRAGILAAATERDLYSKLNTLLAELESSHLVAVSPTENEAQRQEVRARIGLRWLKLEEQWVIDEVVADGPAAMAGVQRGWIGVSINGEPLDKWTGLPIAVGETVVLRVRLPSGEEREFPLQAALVRSTTPPVSRRLADGVVYLRFDDFDAESRRWLSRQLKAHRAAPAVILDLRNNHGGQLFSLNLVAGEFFAHRVAMGRMVKRNGTDFEEKSLRWASAKYTGRVVVLIDRSTYSAAEILAHVLAHHGRATLVGRKTGGAVIAARRYRLPNGGRLDVPVIDYFGLDGKRLEGVGVAPQIAVTRTVAALQARRDEDVEAALLHLADTSPSPEERQN